MKYPLIQFYLIFALLLGSTLMFAQKELPSEKVDVFTSYQATIKDKDKQNIKPVIAETVAKTPDLKFVLQTTNPVDIKYDAPGIRPLAMKVDKSPKAYNGFAKLGYGIPSTPYLNAGYNYAYEDKFKIYADVFHHSANNKSITNQTYSLSSFELGGGVNTAMNFAIDGKFRLEDRQFNFYSIDSLPTGVEPLRKFNIASFGAKAYNSAENSWGVNYDVGFDYTNLSSNYKTSENDFDIHLKGTKWFADNVPFTIVMGNHLTSLTDSLKSSLNNFYLRPSIAYSGDIFKLKFGANLIATNDEFAILPDIEAAVNIAGNALGIYAGFNGDVRKNTYLSLITQNPFLVQNQELTNSKFNRIYGGIRGKVGVIQYQGEAGFKNVTNMPFFVNDSLKTYGFDVIYDKLKVFDINGTLIIDLAKGLQFNGLVRYNIYTTDKLLEPWHLPKLETNLGLSLLTMNDKLKLKSELYIASASFRKNYESNEASKNNALFDISFEASYRFSERFGFFFQLNNLPNNKYKLYYNTPTYGLNILGGLTARF